MAIWDVMPDCHLRAALLRRAHEEIEKPELAHESLNDRLDHLPDAALDDRAKMLMLFAVGQAEFVVNEWGDAPDVATLLAMAVLHGMVIGTEAQGWYDSQETE